jgi:hypothetical protein
VGGTGVFQIRTRVVDGTLDPATADAPTFVDVLPPGLTFVSAGPSPPWSCVASGQQVACTYLGPPVQEGNALPPVNITVQVAGPPRTVRNCAVLGSDFDLGNNRGCDGVPIRGDSIPRDTVDLAIRKRALEEPFTVGGPGAFRIETEVLQGTLNPTAVPGPTFVDVLPPGLTFNSVSHPDWTCTAVGAQVSCTYHGVAVTAVNPLPPLTMVVNVVGPADSVRNCAVLARDAVSGNNEGCDDVVLVPGDTVRPDTVDLRLQK